MTEPAAALMEIGHRPLIPLTALLELRRLALVWISSLDSSEAEGEQDAELQVATNQSVRRSGGEPSAAVGRSARAESDIVIGAVDAGTGKNHRDGGER